jgi:hypothetical protein
MVAGQSPGRTQGFPLRHLWKLSMSGTDIKFRNGAIVHDGNEPGEEPPNPSILLSPAALGTAALAPRKRLRDDASK